MAKIICPNKQYNGISASVPFTNGIGETDKPHLIEWFKEHGYTIEGEPQGGKGGKGGGIVDMTVKELKAYAADKGIDLGEAKTKADIVAAIEAAEAADGDDEGGEGGNE